LEQVKIGQLLCDNDIITKRQLNQALQLQIKGDKRTLGEILVDKGFCEYDDISELMMGTSHGESPPEVEVENEVEISENKVMGTKFSMSIGTIVGLISLISTGVGGYYMLLQEIEEAKELPTLETLYESEYPTVGIEEKNWPISFLRYEGEISRLMDDVDELFNRMEKLEEENVELRIQIAKKRNK
jgi:hypothetical protein|tara:strand:- start:906 stop:1463 length:558 start_codon:yes stop_codon:yes gene_type:complete